MTFSEALHVLKGDGMVTRTSWREELFVFRQIPSEIKKDIVPRMQSLPDDVKKEFQRRFESATMQIDAIYYSDQFAIVNESNLITSYSPSVSDVLALDWVVYGI